MKLQGRIQVEQLDEERLTNIERKLVVAVSDMRAPAERTSRRTLAFAGVVMAIAVAGFVGYKVRPSAVATPSDEPQTLAINTDKTNTIRLGDTQLTAGPGTDVVVERTRKRVVIAMNRGTLDMVVAHDPSRLLVVRAGDIEIEDVGTHFTVEYDGGSKLAVRVTEGEVMVKRAGKHETISAGFAWTTDMGRLAIAALDRTNIVAVAPTAPTTAPAVPAVPAVSAVVTPPVAAGSAAEAPGSATPSVDAGSGSAASARKPGKSNARVALEKLAIEQPLDVGTDDLNTAISKYLELAVGMADSQDKTQVLYSMAVMQHRARQDKAALYTLSAVIKRQGGKAYHAALWLNVRIECMQRFDDECRQAADLYLRKVPDGVAAGVAQTILVEITRGP